MTKEMEFFIFLMEQYACYKNTTAEFPVRSSAVFPYRPTDYVFDMYEMYHTEALENAYKDIDKVIESKSK